MRRMSPLERLDVVNEIRLLASILHVNICRYYEAFMDGNFLCIVMEFAINGVPDASRRSPCRELLNFRAELRWSMFSSTLCTCQCTLLVARSIPCMVMR